VKEHGRKGSRPAEFSFIAFFITENDCVASDLDAQVVFASEHAMNDDDVRLLPLRLAKKGSGRSFLGHASNLILEKNWVHCVGND
jgi:hypothetical protein